MKGVGPILDPQPPEHRAVVSGDIACGEVRGVRDLRPAVDEDPVFDAQTGSLPDVPAIGSQGCPRGTACQSEKYRVTIFPVSSGCQVTWIEASACVLRAMVATTSLGRVSLMAMVDLLVGIAQRTACLSSANLLAPLIAISNGSAGLAHLLEPEWQSAQSR
ncbi:MAG: hypothetical protein JST59_11085 [Actinobacteria bacterium]|nr:hypothetical protein [Actinomycetota bacterium]